MRTLGASAAIPAYVALLLGMLVIGAPAQQHGIVTGLWATEALAIALPAVFVLLFAGVRLGSYFGFRPLTWTHVAVAAAVAAANQPVVSFLTWAAHAMLPVMRRLMPWFAQDPTSRTSGLSNSHPWN